MILADFPKNIIDFQKQYGSEEQCILYVRKQRWGNEGAFECPKCKHTKGWQGITRDILYCAACEHQVSITAGTVFHKTKKPLHVWFMAMYLMSSNKRGMSAKELQKQLGLGSYQTAWAWLHKLRRAMVVPDRNKLSGSLEVDETYCGGLSDSIETKGRSLLEKTAIICAVEKVGECCGRARLGVIPNTSVEALKTFIVDNIAAGSSLVTDGWSGYSSIDKAGYQHFPKVISKSGAKAYISLPLVHRLISNMKRWVLGTHQGCIAPKHLQSYMDEYIFRFNRRHAKSISHRFQRLMEGAVLQQCDPYWKIAGRLSGKANDGLASTGA